LSEEIYPSGRSLLSGMLLAAVGPVPAGREMLPGLAGRLFP
jgi:hypothetical protein